MHSLAKAGVIAGAATTIFSSFGNCQSVTTVSGACGTVIKSASASVASGTPTGTAALGGTPSGTAPGSAPSGGPTGSPPGGDGGSGSGTVNSGTGLYVLTDGQAINGGSYSCEANDTSVFIANGTVSATLIDVDVVKTGDTSSDDDSSFYGLNAGILAIDTAVLNITGGSVLDYGQGSDGVFAYGDATIYISGTRINVTGGNSGGIEAAGGGTMYASNLIIDSNNKAAIRSDRGGGYMIVEGGTYRTSGAQGAPAVYSTANITVSDAILTAVGSEALVIEGLNELTINNCTVSGNMGVSGTQELHNVMLYQSMSGDAEDGTSEFTMNGGSMESLSGCMFYVTNTDAIVTLKGAELTLSGDSNYLFNVSGNDASNGWGSVGSNGGNATLNLSGQTVSGDIYVDSISTLTVNIENDSALTAAINPDGTTAGGLAVVIDTTSTWTLDGDSYVLSFTGSLDNVEQGSYTLYVDGTAASA
ncbi:hypothetical protein EDB81DRAFT_782412 [Dactylonectria macrodidyma]|uniref:Uncharacterized protein n=1 Tax=Dactylonectria macrodidyma TaxID=307937 RepID=A0A9P9JGN3_9HYPO|nr:hypothetical protein EDB81DRAFT_782412 [Dactylonectria macrodidyma]